MRTYVFLVGTIDMTSASGSEARVGVLAVVEFAPADGDVAYEVDRRCCCFDIRAAR